MTDVTLRADGARCAALCCVGLAFDRSALFAFDKPAGVACRHLGSGHHCGIHEHLADSGFAGCAHYDCLGAGQRVTQDLFGGRSWRDDPAWARQMLQAFRLMRRVHELLLLLRTAAKLPLTLAQRTERLELLALLAPAGLSVPALDAFGRSGLDGDIRKFLGGLKDVATPPDDA